ncbi:mitochondrial fission ELM1 family protein [Benzoatithermus flavus]|uniref:ELM1/GtrOC1 family putative glycosyltransferase n=1 Tax=Benzoatithermus flavus TaxID=3108223 RepID=A0ABU8XQN8_9PROT
MAAILPTSSSDVPPAAAPAPRTWLLIGDKLGDNAQAKTLADALGWPYEVRRVLPKPEWVLGKPAFAPTLDHLDLARSDRLEPPWPDLVVTIGRRPSMAALWVQDRSGGRTRIVLVGPPKRWPERFALIVAPGQFRIPPRDNLVQLDLPLMRADPARVAAAGEAWRERLADLQRPLTAVLVGGETKPYRFDAEAASDLLCELERLRARDGGSLYLTTSRRTRPEVVAALEAGLPEGARFYRWSAETGSANPYLGLLAHADRFVVTGDSVSMMVEVASLGKPLAIFELPLARGFGRRMRVALAELAGGGGGPLGRLTRSLLHRFDSAGYVRDLGEIHRLLIRRGLAVRLGEPFRPAEGPLADELAPVVARIRGLFG